MVSPARDRSLSSFLDRSCLLKMLYTVAAHTIWPSSFASLAGPYVGYLLAIPSTLSTIPCLCCIWHNRCAPLFIFHRRRDPGSLPYQALPVRPAGRDLPPGGKGPARTVQPGRFSPGGFVPRPVPVPDGDSGRRGNPRHERRPFEVHGAPDRNRPERARNRRLRRCSTTARRCRSA